VVIRAAAGDVVQPSCEIVRYFGQRRPSFTRRRLWRL
jgi:hypothetical protein